MMFVIAIVAMVLDQITKRMVEADIALGASVNIPGLSPYLTWTHTQNTGASFSMLQNAGGFFIIVAIVVSGLIIYYAPRLPADDWLSRVGLGLQLGGAIGNMVDRLRQGYVTDFVHFRIPEIGFDWPVFNVADSCIFVGVIVLLFSSFMRERREARAQVAPGNGPPQARDHAAN